MRAQAKCATSNFITAVLNRFPGQRVVGDATSPKDQTTNQKTVIDGERED